MHAEGKSDAVQEMASLVFDRVLHAAELPTNHEPIPPTTASCDKKMG